jgi:hypothetical protein
VELVLKGHGGQGSHGGQGTGCGDGQHLLLKLGHALFLHSVVYVLLIN